MSHHLAHDQVAAATAAANAKWAFTTRHVERAHVASLLPAGAALQPGQLLLARVERLGQHTGLQLANGRRAALYEGDEIVACLGARYAPDQFEGEARLTPQGEAELLAAGGVIGNMRHRHARMKAATRLQVLGCLGDAQGQALNIARYRQAMPVEGWVNIPVIVVAGSSMNAGKTTACASLIHGLARSGWRVGATKVTGTGSFGDVQSYADAGAAEVVDFTDAGHVSTYQVDLPELESVSMQLLLELQRRRCDVAVVEIADGLFQSETAALLRSPIWRAMDARLLYAAADALGAVGGVERLLAQQWPLVGFTGMVTCSPLAASEAQAALVATGVGMVTRDELRNPAALRQWLPHLHMQGLKQAA